MELAEDYLEPDREIRGQNFVCLSFISPENVLNDKHLFQVHEFLKSICPEYKLDDTTITNQYKDFMFKHSVKINKQFSELNNFRTSVRGLKVRGTYDTLQEAEMRAKRLQKSDSNFNVFVGQVGYWLPWDPEPKEVGNENYLNNDLNTLMSKYQDNMDQRDEMFNSRKRDLIRKNDLEVQAQQARLDELDKNTEQVNTVSDSLTGDDLWLQRQNKTESLETVTETETSAEAVNTAVDVAQDSAEAAVRSAVESTLESSVDVTTNDQK